MEPSLSPLAEMQAVFLSELRRTGNVSAAARRAKRARGGFYRDRDRDPAFAADWADALEEATDWLELEAVRRAVEGTEEDRFYQGTAVGTVTRYSDGLLMFLLKARRPSSFDPRYRGVESRNGINEDAIRASIEHKLAQFHGGDDAG